MDLLQIQPFPSTISRSTNNPLNTQSTKNLRKIGKKKFKETHHPIYKGVRQKNSRKWVCEIREPNKKSRIWLGTFSTPEKAARAYDVAVLALRGEMSELNFADSAQILKRARSSAPKDIQNAAFEAAMTFQVSSSNSYPSPSSVSTHLTNFDTKEEMSKKYSVTMGSIYDDSLVFVDEEALFNMPGLIDSMAEGLLLTPPAMEKGFNWDDENDCDLDLTLW